MEQITHRFDSDAIPISLRLRLCIIDYAIDHELKVHILRIFRRKNSSIFKAVENPVGHGCTNFPTAKLLENSQG